jgi:hypothetical protein
MRGLNETGGRNRLRFQKLKSRVKHERSRVDVVHKVCVACCPSLPSLPPFPLGYPPHHPAYIACLIPTWFSDMYFDDVACKTWHVVWAWLSLPLSCLSSYAQAHPIPATLLNSTRTKIAKHASL